MSTKKDMKFDGDKCRLDLIDPAFTEGVGNVLTFGAKKYEAESWKTVENGLRRYLTAAERHILAIKKGEINDSESGLPHAYHAATDLMMVQWFVDHIKKPCAEYDYRACQCITSPFTSEPGGITEVSKPGPLTQTLVQSASSALKPTAICPVDDEVCDRPKEVKCTVCDRGRFRG
jgi:hypothetical protein